MLFLDCDSTLSAIEGIDELARLRGDECCAEIEAMTHEAMEGKVTIEYVFGKRLRAIQPTRKECARVGQMYIERIEPGVVEMLAAARSAGWTPCILSGGFEPVIAPLAEHLGIEWVEAVGLYFDEDGRYSDYEFDYYTTSNGGKPIVIRKAKRRLRLGRTIMVGDGISDLETQPEVDLFVGYGGVVRRPRVEAEAKVFITQFSELLPHLIG